MEKIDERIDLEKNFKMVAIEKPKEVDISREIKLFDEIFPRENNNNEDPTSSENPSPKPSTSNGTDSRNDSNVRRIQLISTVSKC